MIFWPSFKADTDHFSLFHSLRAFCAWEEEVIVDSDAEHKQRLLLDEYKTKLIVDGQVIPDPMTLKKGWPKEDDEGLLKCSSIYFHDIANYVNTKTSADLLKQLINEYKVGKYLGTLLLVG